MADMHTTGRVRVRIWRHAGKPDTICITDEQGYELVNWMGFDGNIHSKATTRANARRFAAGWNALLDATQPVDEPERLGSDVVETDIGALALLMELHGYIQMADKSGCDDLIEDIYGKKFDKRLAAFLAALQHKGEVSRG